ncbi:MAG: FAD:protein FMN transferase [Pirellulales bacterium]
MVHERQTRRSFLHGHAASRELVGRIQRIDVPAAMANRRTLIASVRRRAMACEFEVQLAAARDDNAMEHVFAALDLVEALEAQLSVYRDDSEVSRINQTAQQFAVPVEPQLFQLIEQARQLHADTGGALDITSGPLSEIWGFSRREGRVPSDDQVAAALQRVGMQHVELDAARRTIMFRQPGMSINFNSLGKGYALDRMATLVAEHGVDDILLQGGKSSVLARGNQPGGSGTGWLVGVRHPLRNDVPLAQIVLHDQALSTSGAGTQFFIRRGQRYGHILDPRTGRPAEGLYSATVLAPTATQAEGLSTAFYVMGPQKAAEYCAARPEIAALLVAPGERAGDVRLNALGQDSSRWLRLADD